MDYETISMERLGAVGRITLNRPEKLNAINIRMGVEFCDAVEELEADDAIRCLIITGAGRSFCAGDDLSGMNVPGYERRTMPDAVKEYVYARGRFTYMVHAMRRCPKPVIGLIRGHAYGGGLNLALATDIRICSEDARFCTPFTQRGLATGCNLLQYFVGLGVALEMAMLGDPIDAYRAERLGLVYKVVPNDRLEEEGMALADRLSKGATRAIGLAKAAILKGWFKDADTAYDYQGYAQTLNSLTEDRKEGVQAFLEKRQPQFKGR